MRPVYITGVGAVSPNGVGAEAYYSGCLAGRSGVSALSAGAAAGEAAAEYAHLKVWAAGQVLGFNAAAVIGDIEARRVPRMVPFALAACREALGMAGYVIDPADVEGQRHIGMSLGTGGGGLAFVEEQYKTFFREGKGSLFSITGGTHGNLASDLSVALKLRGPSHVLSTGCTSSTDAIGYAMMLVGTGQIDAMLAGGSDAPIAPGILTAFEKMRVISTRRWDDATMASRPYQTDRDGFVVGEGSWFVLLESESSMMRRAAGVKPLARVSGYASTCDAYHRTQIAPDVAEPVRAMQLAMQRAEVTPEDIGYVNLHGTATELNDRLETVAIKRALGERALQIGMSSTKSMIGHPQGACGSAGVVATTLGIARGTFHPTINQTSPDPLCDLDYLKSARKMDVRHALCNCIAFGSKNSAIVLSAV